MPENTKQFELDRSEDLDDLFEVIGEPDPEELRADAKLRASAVVPAILGMEGLGLLDFLKGLGDRVPTQMIGAITILVLFATWKRVKQNLDWRKRENRAKLQVSLSSIHDGEDGADLWMNKLAEGQMEDLLNDGIVVKILRGGCRKTTDDDALVRVPKKHRERVERTLKTLITKLLEDPEEVLRVHKGEVEKEEVSLWVAFTFERYGMRRNLIPRLIIVPEENLTEDIVGKKVVTAPGLEHRNLRVDTHRTMLQDIQRVDGPEACFKITITRAKGV